MPTESDKEVATRPVRHFQSRALAVSALAESQHGVIARWQLTAMGLTPAEIRSRVASRHLIGVHRTVYAVGYRPLTAMVRWWAAILAAGDGAVLSHASAGALWGIAPDDPREIHVTTSAIQRRGHAGVRVHRNHLDEKDQTVHAGVPVTTALRTLIDLAAMAPPAVLERAIRQAHYERIADDSSLAAAVTNLAGQRGIRKLRLALSHVAEAPGVTRSELEAAFLRFLRRHSLPMPKLNVPIRTDGRTFEVDCLWRSQGVIVELDGKRAHATASAFEADRARDSALQAAGYRVVRITWRRLHDDQEALADELRALLERK